MSSVLTFIIIFGTGIIIGFCLCSRLIKNDSVGVLKLYPPDPSDMTNNPYLFLELFNDTRYLKNEKYITLEVRNMPFPQK